MQITLRDVNKSFNSNHILKNLDLSFGDGEFVTLLGPSGCGKTTTLRCVAGLEDPDSGTITAGDRTFADAQAHSFLPAHKRKIGMVFQSYALWPHMTVHANVAYPLKRRKTPQRDLKNLVARTLQAVGMDAHAHRYPHELSGGQQQRVALARGLVSAGGVMLFDEPLSNLDAKLRVAMRTEIRRLHNEFGNTSLYVTHDQEEALALSDRIVIMNGGRVEQIGTPEEIHSRPVSRFAADFVGFENVLECVRGTGPGSTPGLTAGGLSFVPGPGHAPGASPGDAFAFRGKNVRLGTVEDAALTGRGVVCDSTYIGEVWTARIEVADGVAVHVEVPAGAQQFIGRGGDGVAVEFSVHRDHVVVLGR